MASKESISEDADHYIVSYEEDGFVVIQVWIKKPCPLREIFQRAEKVMAHWGGPPVDGGTKPGG
jgi:hypothetical protein